MIETIKQQGNGWLVNGSKAVPNDPRNSDCQEVLAYIDEGGQIADEFTPEEVEAQRISAIKREVTPLIYSKIMDDHKQRNSMAKLIGVLFTALQDPTILDDPAIIAEANIYLTKWKQLFEVVEVSNKAEAAGTAPEDVPWPI